MSRGRLAALCLLAAGASAPAAAADGRAVFEANCAACHQADGNGVPGFIPPLSGTLGHFLAVPGGRDYLINVVTNGLVGDIWAQGQGYAGNMPAFGGRLGAAEVAVVLDYVLTRFNAGSLPGDYTPPDAEAVAATADEHLNANDMNRQRAELAVRLAREGLER